jgi:hypothetical protein
MLGEVIGEFSGKITGVKVLPPEGQVPMIEASIQGTGKVLGKEATVVATYLQTVKAGGGFYAEGQAVIMTPMGDVATSKGFGVGRPTGPGFSASFAVCGSFDTGSASLERLNGVATVGEYDAKENGDWTWRIWEWKSKA